MIEPDLLAVLACPVCREALVAAKEGLQCEVCSAGYPVVEGIPDLCPPGYDASGEYAGDPEPGARLRQRWDRNHLLQDPSVQYLMREAIAQLGHGERLLDAGAGTGTIAAMLARLAPERAALFITDLSPAMLALARRNLSGCGNTRLFRAEAHSPPYRPEVFDIILSRLTPFGYPNALSALRPGGTYLDVDFGAAHWRELDEIFAERRIRYGDHYTDNDRRAYARKVGFAEVETHGWLWEAVHSLAELQDVLDFAPVIDEFDRERDQPLLEELQRRFGAEGGVRLTHEPRLTLCRKGL